MPHTDTTLEEWITQEIERLGISGKSLWTEKEYASYRCCSVSTAQKERHLGKGPIYLKIGHQVRYRPEDVIRFCFGRRINHLTK